MENDSRCDIISVHSVTDLLVARHIHRQQSPEPATAFMREGARDRIYIQPLPLPLPVCSRQCTRTHTHKHTLAQLCIQRTEHRIEHTPSTACYNGYRSPTRSRAIVEHSQWQFAFNTHSCRSFDGSTKTGNSSMYCLLSLFLLICRRRRHHRQFHSLFEAEFNSRTKRTIVHNIKNSVVFRLHVDSGCLSNSAIGKYVRFSWCAF